MTSYMYPANESLTLFYYIVSRVTALYSICLYTKRAIPIGIALSSIA